MVFLFEPVLLLISKWNGDGDEWDRFQKFNGPLKESYVRVIKICRYRCNDGK